MTRQLFLVASWLCLPATAASVDDLDSEQIQATVIAKLAEAIVDSIGILNPANTKEMIANISIDAETGRLMDISYSGRSMDGAWLSATDGNADGQPETIIFLGEEGSARVWIRDTWRQVVKQDGHTGVILDGQWHRVRRDPETRQWDLFDGRETSKN